MELIKMLKELWQRIKDLFKAPYKKLRLKEDIYSNWSTMNSKLVNLFPKADIYITDAKMCHIYQEDMRKVASTNLSKFLRWEPEVHDCDNFAFEFKGIMSYLFGRHAFGIVFVDTPRGGHALNCFVDEFGKFNYFEPQNNTIISLEDGNRLKYKPYLVVI